MKLKAFSSRTAKEIIRDPLNLAFGLGFPVVLILLLSAIQANIPVELFVIENLSPGIAIFGLSFMTLFPQLLLPRTEAAPYSSGFTQRPLRPRILFWDTLSPYCP